MVVGLNYRTAPVAIRERFSISESRRYEALVQLSRAEGIEEVIILSTCNRTEFWFWASDVTLAANSVMRLLGAEYGLKLCQWKHFYRLLDEAALLHIFRVACSLDSMVIGEPQVVSQVNDAWKQAQKVGATGRSLDSVLQKALLTSRRVHTETAISNVPVSIPYAAVELTRQIFGTLENKKVVLLGAGMVSELSARGFLSHGASSIRVVNRTFEHAVKLAAKLGGLAVQYADRLPHMAEADIIISSTSCPNTILSREEAERLMSGRQDHPLVIVDIGIPRDIDPEVRNIKGIFLHDIDDLENVADRNADEREAAAIEAQKILLGEAQGFRGKLKVEQVVPTVVALRRRLDELCRQELDSFRRESGPFSNDEDEMLKAVTSRMTQKIAASLALELRAFPEKAEQEQMTVAVRRLFHLQSTEPALTGTRA
jgi:glutamyl-tRNA reductase